MTPKRAECIALRQSKYRCRTCCALWLVLIALASPAFAEPLRLTFDDLRTSWQWQATPAQARLLRQERNRRGGRESGGEVVEYVTRGAEGMVSLEHAVSPCRAFDELEATVWVRASHPGWEVLLRVVAPNIVSPVTNEPAAFFVRGAALRNADRWEPLHCRTSDREIADQLRWVRAKYPGAGDPGELYVDQVVLRCRITESTTASLSIDELEMTPIVPVSTPAPRETAVSESATLPPVEFQLDRIQIGGKPFFPRLVCDHGEPAETLADSGCNLVWVADVSQTARFKELQQQRLWAAATPPRPQSPSGDPLSAKSAGLVPFSAATDPVLCWLMGIRLGGGEREATVDWIDQVRAADRRRNRPIAAEVLTDERLYSRDVQLLGVSRHAIGTTLSLPDCREWLSEHRGLARPGAFCWTWIQCEPSPSAMDAVSPWASTPQLEPEQIRLQVYAALAAGCRGIGFWTTQPLDGADPATRERFLAMKQVNLELELLAPWLATMGGASRVPCSVLKSPTRTATPKTTSNAVAVASPIPGLSATVLQTDYGTLVMPVWLDSSSQYVPAHAAMQNVSFVVPGVGATAEAFEVSPTRIAHLSGLQSKKVAGGVQITLPRFDQTAIVWFTSDLGLVKTMEQRIVALKKSSAAVSVELARRKLDRVGQIDARLQDIGARQDDGPQLVGKAKLSLEQAQAAFQADDFHAARLHAEETLQSLRILQRNHWNDAVRHLSSPASTPYTLCFQTLPDYWRLVEQVGRSSLRDARNLLPSGEFEDSATLLAEGWQHAQADREDVRAEAELFPGGRKRGYALRLRCLPLAGRETPQNFNLAAVTVASPAIPVRAGQILHISGWVKLAKPIFGSSEGFQVYESILGKSGALRYRDAQDWTRFELLRDVVATGEWKLTLSLTGLGEACIDDVQVLALEPPPERIAQPQDEPRIQPASNSILERLPKLPGFSSRKK